MHTFKDKNVSIGEVWFDEELNGSNDVDVIFYRQRPRPLEGVALDYEDFSTMILDLSKSEDELWSRVHKNDRYKIRRADRDQVIYQLSGPAGIDIALIDRFADFYDQFAAWKGLTKLRRNRLKGYAKNDSLYISNVQTHDGEILGWHSYVRVENRIRLLQSASTRGSCSSSSFRSMLGRANRLHHWNDIVEFKKLGIETYDFGGWYTGDSNDELLAVNHFKEKFGGEVIASVNFSRPVTMKGRLYLTLRKIYIKYAGLRQFFVKGRK